MGREQSPRATSPGSARGGVSGLSAATKEARRQAALAEHETETKAREQVISEALADWQAQAPRLFESLAEEVRRLENQYWQTRKTKDEEEKKELLRQRRRHYNQVAQEQGSPRGQSSGRALADCRTRDRQAAGIDGAVPPGQYHRVGCASVRAGWCARVVCGQGVCESRPGSRERPALELPPSWHFPVRETKGKGTL